MNLPNKIKIKFPIFILSFLLFIVVTTAIFVVPKYDWKCIFNVNKFATAFVFETSDFFYDRSVLNEWTAQGNAWGENIGWLTFSPNSSSTVYVADDAISGYLYGENIGWISLSCRDGSDTSLCNSVNYGVSNDAEGNLSGFAYGENVGWIDFGSSTASYQVKISATGTFSGYAYGENVGWINFNIGASSATTTWTPRSTRPECNDGIDNDGDGNIDYPNDSNCSSLTDDKESPSVHKSSSSPAPSELSPTLPNGQGGDTDIDDVAPVITILGSNPVSVTVGTTYTDAGATAYDAYDDATTTASITSNNVNTSATGTYSVVYSATDLSGNTITATRTVNVTTSTSALPAGFCFNKNLYPYQSDPDIKNLQIFLNNNNFSATSDGLEDNYYSTGTKNAVILFQEYYSISTTGNFGTTTRNKVNNILGCETALEIVTPTSTTTPSHIDSFNQDLTILPEQSGTYTKSTDIGNIVLEVPVSDVQSTTTFSIAKESLVLSDENIALLKIQLNDNTSYNITAKDQEGNYIHSFPYQLTVALPVSADLTKSALDLGVYWFNETTQQWVLISDAVFADNKATFKVNHLTKFAVFGIANEPVSKESTSSKNVTEATSSNEKNTEVIANNKNNENQTPISEAQNTNNPQNNGAGIEAQTTSNQGVTSSGITQSIQQTYNQTVVVAQESIKAVTVVAEQSIQKTKEIVNTPTGSVVTKTVSTVGVVAGASASVGAIAFANPVTLSEIWLIPAKLFGLFMGALGIKRKKKQWGTVYDSVTKRPLDPVYVSLINTETNKEVAGVITDIDGRYGFLPLPGKYRIEVNKTNYLSPSINMKGRLFDEVYNDLYFGEEIVITTEGEIITKNIPMDSLSFDWNEFAKTKMNVNTFMKGKDIMWAKIFNVLFGVGAIVALVSLIFAPAPYNFIISGLYILSYIFNYMVFKTKKSGTLKEKNTNIPLSFAIVKIFREGEDTPLVKKIADKFGDYYALIPNGRYYMKVDKKNDDSTYSEVLKTEVMDIKKGIINMNFAV